MTRSLSLYILLLIFPLAVAAAPGDVLFSDDFESGSLAGNWTVDTANRAGVSTATSNSGNNAMFTRWGSVNVTSNTINTLVPAAQLTIWVQRGDDSFSEDPDNNEDLELQYRNNVGTWVTLETFDGNGTPGQVYNRSYTLGPGALHATFQLRIRQTGGSGSDWDYWHVDDVIITEQAVTPPPPVGSGWKMEAAAVTLNNTQATPVYTTVTFRQTYGVTPLVFVLATSEGSDPSAIRIRNVTTSGFEMTQVEPPGEDGPHISMTVHYLAIEPGVHTLPDGTQLEAGTISTNTVQHGSGVGGGEGWDTVNFTNAYAGSPTVLAQIQTVANEQNAIPGQVSVPWLTVAMRDVTSSDVDLALERSEANDGGAIGSNETIAYLAFESGRVGSFDDNGGASVSYESIRSSDSIRGWDDGCFTVNFAGVYAASPLVIANNNTHDGGDGGWLRRCSLNNVRVGLTVDEDQDRDSERNHTTERAGIMVFSRAFDATFTEPGPIAYYAMDEVQWNGTAGEVVDGSGNGNHGVRIGNADTVANGKVCRAGEVTADGDAINTAVDVDSDIGSRGTISFWFRPNWTQTGGERNTSRVLVDASAGNKYFKIAKSGRGGSIPNAWDRRLVFIFEDSADNDFVVDSSANIFTANTWVYITVTWDFPGDTFEIYVNGNLEERENDNTNGNIPALDTLYLGDNRSNYNPFGMTNGADGTFDEVRIYNRVRSQADIIADMNATHPCGGVDHFAIVHDGNGINCQAERVTIRAHDVSHTVFTGYTGTINLSTSTAHGDWSVITGVVANLTNSGNGAGSYTFDGSENGEVVLGLRNTFVETTNINVADGGVLESITEDPDLAFASAGFNFLADNVASAIGTQIAGKASNAAPGGQTLELQAINTNDDTGACEAFLVNNNTIQLAYECRNPTACTANQVSINGTPVAANNNGAALTYTGVSLDFGDATDTTAAFVMNYPDAGQIRLHARYVLSPSNEEILGASNDFVVRPFGFDIDFSDDRQTNGSGGSSYAADQNGSVFTRAGVNFDTTVTAVVWQAVDDADNNGVPDSGANLADNNPTLNFGQESVPSAVSIGHTLVAPAAGASGSLSGGNNISGFASGAVTTALSWNEAGIINLNASLVGGNYLAGGQNIQGEVLNVGRFIPNHFAVSGGSITNRSASACLNPSSFSYMDEAFATQFTLTAQAAGNSTTSNYTGVFAKLDATSAASFNFGAIDIAASNTPLSARVDTGGAPAGSWANGVLNMNYPLAIFRDSPEDGPFNAVNIGIAPVDTDGVVLNPLNLDTTNNGTDDSGLVAATRILFGRVAIQNGYGSELLDLGVNLHAEYFDSGGFVLNSADDCTTPVTVTLTDVSASDNLDTATETCVQDSGSPGDSGAGCAAPGPAAEQFQSPPDLAGKIGDFNLYLQAPGDGNTGSVDVGVTVPSYLRYDWNGVDEGGDGNLYDDNPSGRATFGIYRGQGQTIYQREQW